LALAAPVGGRDCCSRDGREGEARKKRASLRRWREQQRGERARGQHWQALLLWAARDASSFPWQQCTPVLRGAWQQGWAGGRSKSGLHFGRQQQWRELQQGGGRTGRRCCNGQKEAPPFPVATVCSGAKAQQEESTPALGRRMLLPFILQAAAAVAGAAERRRGSSGGRCCTSRRRRLCAGGAFFSRSSSVPVLRGARRGRRAGVWRNGERNSSSLHHPPSTVLDPPSSIHYLPSSIHHSAAVAGAAARRGQH
ncbi:hypothetical protein CLOP_g25573, partial [Closterium sp. NIES-67]